LEVFLFTPQAGKKGAAKKRRKKTKSSMKKKKGAQKQTAKRDKSEGEQESSTKRRRRQDYASMPGLKGRFSVCGVIDMNESRGRRSQCKNATKCFVVVTLKRQRPWDTPLPGIHLRSEGGERGMWGPSGKNQRRVEP